MIDQHSELTAVTRPTPPLGASTSTRLIVAAEPWLPTALGVTWWIAMYPGLFGEDSLITLNEARTGPITAWFTAWWIFVIDFVTVGTRAIALLTLAGVMLLTWAVRVWAAACFPPGAARAWPVALVCASPLVGALGIQVRHDAWMTAGLLLCVAVMTRTDCVRDRFRAADGAQLVAATLLIATRHNGLATLILAAAGSLWMFGRDRARYAATLGVVALGVAGVTQVATRAAGLAHSTDPAQAVEWLMADVSCLLSQDGIEPSAGDWAVLEAIASRADWPQATACRFVNPLFIAASFRSSQVEQNLGPLVRTWLGLTRRYPAQMAVAHLRRVSLFLPPFVLGLPDRDHTPFIHSTILPNEFGLEWAFPRVANLARVPARAWNAMRDVLANAALWLLFLALVAWRWRDRRAALMPTLLVGVALEIGLLATAPISEGRYGLFILVCGQVTALHLWFESRGRATATASS